MNRIQSTFSGFLATFLTLFSTVALAQDGPAPNPFGQLVMLGVFIGLMYLLLIRPQSKRQKEHRELVSNLSKGDEVLTNGGLTGKIVDINEQFITLAIASNVEVMMQKPAVTAILPKGTLTNLG